MTDEKKDAPIPFEYERMTDAEAIEFVKQLDLPREAYAVVHDHPSAGKIRDVVLEMVSRRDFSFSEAREKQASALWAVLNGSVPGIDTWERYLETIPSPYANPDPKRFDRLVLVDRRPVIGGGMRADLCRRFGVTFHLNDEELVDRPFRGRYGGAVGFIWCQDGRLNRGRGKQECLAAMPSGETALTAIEGLCLFAQDRTVLTQPDRLLIDLPATFSRNYPDRSPCLKQVGEYLELDWYHGGDAHESYGTATRAA